jgi:hypothetical protein
MGGNSKIVGPNLGCSDEGAGCCGVVFGCGKVGLISAKGNASKLPVPVGEKLANGAAPAEASPGSLASFNGVVDSDGNPT